MLVVEGRISALPEAGLFAFDCSVSFFFFLPASRQNGKAGDLVVYEAVGVSSQLTLLWRLEPTSTADADAESSKAASRAADATAEETAAVVVGNCS